MNRYRMPFGKHRGDALDALPAEYLAWLTTIELREPLRSAVRAEEARRAATTTAREAAPPLAADIVDVGFRQLATRLHPDRGGSNADMRTLLVARQWLRAKVQGALA